MYQQAVSRLIRAADEVADYRADLAAFTDTLAGKRWGAEVTGPIQDMDSRLTAIEGTYRDLAAQMKHQGDQGSGAYDQAPWVPGNLVGEQLPVPTTPGTYVGLGVGRKEVVRATPQWDRSNEREARVRPTHGTERFEAIRLKLADIPGTARVNVGAGPGTVEVRISGPDSMVAKVQRYVLDDTLHIAGPGTAAGGGGGGGMTIISGGGGGVTVIGNMTIGGGRIVVDGVELKPGGEPSARVEIEVDIPWHTAVMVDDKVAGRYEIGDTEGALMVQMRGSSTLVAGRVADTRAVLQGSCDVQIERVTGNRLEGTLQGSADLVVRDGRVDTVSLTAQGSADAVYGGVARRADLVAMGSADIRVNEVTEALSDRAMGSADVRVHMPPRRSRDTFWN